MCWAGPTRPQRALSVEAQHLTALTTFANEVSATVHDRVPLVVQAKDYVRWLDRENEDVEDLLVPYPTARMAAYLVSRRVNDPKNDDAKLIEPEAA